jgi:hypothetical protein
MTKNVHSFEHTTLKLNLIDDKKKIYEKQEREKEREKKERKNKGK